MKRLTFAIVGVLFLVFSIITIAIAANITIDETLTDWTNTTNLPVPVFHTDGAADDYGTSASTGRNDITQFGLAINPSIANYFYLLYAWDDTDWPANDSYYAATTIKSPSGTYYRVRTYLGKNLADSDVNRITIQSCGSDPNCPTPTTCTGTACNCSGFSVALNSNTNWADPFSGVPGHTSANCQGTNCSTLDTAVELQIPWCAVGGAPTGSAYFFSAFASYDSTGVLLDGAGSNGIACKLDLNNNLYCYKSTPTDLGITSFTGAAQSVPPLAWGGMGLAVVGLAVIGSRKLIRAGKG